MFKWLTQRIAMQRASAQGLHLKQTDAQRRQILVQDPRYGGFDKSYNGLSVYGYEKNIIAYHCINKIAIACADVDFEIEINGTELEDENHPIYKLLKRPNAAQSYKDFIYTAVSHKLISGNAYFHVLMSDLTANSPQGIELFRPDRVYIDVVDGIAKRYIYNFYGKEYYYPIDRDTGLSDILHVKNFHPLCDLYGLSPITAAQLAIGQYNEASLWNTTLLQNSSKPAGILSLKDKGDNAPSMSMEQAQSLTSQINNKYAGPKNAGKILALSHDMNFQQLSLSPSDMEWLNGKNASARDVCLAFGYPAFLLGLPDSTSTYNNVEQAKLSLYEETILPLLNTIHESLSWWLSELSGQEIDIEADTDTVSALLPRRQVARENARLDVAAGIISINEAREEMDYPPVPGGDEPMVPAGKLPLNFDLTGLTPAKFERLLIDDGMAPLQAKTIALAAFEGKAVDEPTTT